MKRERFQSRILVPVALIGIIFIAVATLTFWFWGEEEDRQSLSLYSEQFSEALWLFDSAKSGSGKGDAIRILISVVSTPEEGALAYEKSREVKAHHDDVALAKWKKVSEEAIREAMPFSARSVLEILPNVPMGSWRVETLVDAAGRDVRKLKELLAYCRDDSYRRCDSGATVFIGAAISDVSEEILTSDSTTFTDIMVLYEVINHKASSIDSSPILSRISELFVKEVLAAAEKGDLDRVLVLYSHTPRLVRESEAVYEVTDPALVGLAKNTSDARRMIHVLREGSETRKEVSRMWYEWSRADIEGADSYEKAVGAFNNAPEDLTDLAVSKLLKDFYSSPEAEDVAASWP